MSQGDFLMMRKRINSRHEQEADEVLCRRHVGSAREGGAPARQSMTVTTDFLLSLKSASVRRGRPSVVLSAPPGGLMESSDAPRGAGVEYRVDRQDKVIAERLEAEKQRLEEANEAKRSYLMMLREKERMRLRQRTVERQTLEGKTVHCADGTTLQAQERAEAALLPQRTFVAENRDRMEVNLVRRGEEIASLALRSSKRRNLETLTGTTFALAQEKLQSTVGSHGGSLPTPEEAHKAQQRSLEEDRLGREERDNVATAMRELSILDDQLRADEKTRKAARLERKEQLRQASRNRN